MEKLVSMWYKNQSLPEDYIFPPGTRPGKSIVPVCNDIPVVDLSTAVGCNRSDTIQKILKAGKEFGFFQVHTHLSLRGFSDSLVLFIRMILINFIFAMISRLLTMEFQRN